MRHDAETIQFMRNVLEEVEYEIEENPAQTGWSWVIGTAECQAKPLTLQDAVQDAWASAADYVRDILGGHISHDEWLDQWEAMSVGQQARLILLCFDCENEGAAISDGLLQTMRENDLLKTTLLTLGGAIEVGDNTVTRTAWRQAKATHQLSAPA